jgi:hypothetical protein
VPHAISLAQSTTSGYRSVHDGMCFRVPELLKSRASPSAKLASFGRPICVSSPSPARFFELFPVVFPAVSLNGPLDFIIIHKAEESIKRNSEEPT